MTPVKESRYSHPGTTHVVRILSASTSLRDSSPRMNYILSSGCVRPRSPGESFRGQRLSVIGPHIPGVGHVAMKMRATPLSSCLFEDLICSGRVVSCPDCEHSTSKKVYALLSTRPAQPFLRWFVKHPPMREKAGDLAARQTQQNTTNSNKCPSDCEGRRAASHCTLGFGAISTTFRAHRFRVHVSTSLRSNLEKQPQNDIKIDMRTMSIRISLQSQSMHSNGRVVFGNFSCQNFQGERTWDIFGRPVLSSSITLDDSPTEKNSFTPSSTNVAVSSELCLGAKWCTPIGSGWNRSSHENLCSRSFGATP